MCRAVVSSSKVSRTSVRCDCVDCDWEYQSVGDLVIRYEWDRIKEILHESDRDRLVYTDGTDTSSVAPSQSLQKRNPTTKLRVRWVTSHRNRRLRRAWDQLSTAPVVLLSVWNPFVSVVMSPSHTREIPPRFAASPAVRPIRPPDWLMYQFPVYTAVGRAVPVARSLVRDAFLPVYRPPSVISLDLSTVIVLSSGRQVVL